MSSLWTVRFNWFANSTAVPTHAAPGTVEPKAPRFEPRIALPGWIIGWDVSRRIGHRRFARHSSIPQIRMELLDSHAIALSENSVANYARHYQIILAARQQDLDTLRGHYCGVDQLILSIDGSQPEKGHETLYVVRELMGKRVWFAEALISASTDEVRQLIALAKRWAETLGKSVALWISDKQHAFVTGIRAEFPGVPYRTSPTISCGIWPSLSWRPTAMRRFKCERKSAVCEESNDQS